MRLYVIHGSHPCATVERALRLKQVSYQVIEWPPLLHRLFQRVLFGAVTVPALRNGAEKVVGSRTILRRLDELVPEPPLYPAELGLRTRVDAAERWGDETFQQVARDIIGAALSHCPGALVSYSEHSRIRLPGVAVRLLASTMASVGRLLDRSGDCKARRRLEQLPGQLDQIDAWIGDGTLGDAHNPTAAGLQILSTVRLLTTIGDAGPLLEGRRCSALAHALFPVWDGQLPAGAIPGI